MKHIGPRRITQRFNLQGTGPVDLAVTEAADTGPDDGRYCWIIDGLYHREVTVFFRCTGETARRRYHQLNPGFHGTILRVTRAVLDEEPHEHVKFDEGLVVSGAPAQQDEEESTVHG